MKIDEKREQISAYKPASICAANTSLPSRSCYWLQVMPHSSPVLILLGSHSWALRICLSDLLCPAHPLSPVMPPQESCPGHNISSSSGKSSPFQCAHHSFGEIYYIFLRSLFLSPRSGWSFTLHDSISSSLHPLRSGRLPDGAPLGHICSLFGKQRLNSSAELTACSLRQFASCRAANASLAFQGDVISAAFKGWSSFSLEKNR